MSNPIAWLNGRIISAAEAAVPVTDLGVVSGATVTEMIRTFRHEPYRLDAHLDRLISSLELCDFPVPVPTLRTELTAAVTEVVAANGRLIPEDHDLGIITFITAGPNPTYLGAAGLASAGTGTMCVHTFPLPFEFWADKQRNGQHLASVSVASLPVDSVSPQAKHRNRLHWYRADKEARGRFDGATALLETKDGLLTETSAGNVFIVTNRTIRTPHADLVLGGIGQQCLHEIAGRLGFECEDAPLRLSDIEAADEILTTSTTYCLLPVTRFNGHSVCGGKPGPVFHELIAAWSGQVGVDIVQQAADAARDRTSSAD